MTLQPSHSLGSSWGSRSCTAMTDPDRFCPDSCPAEPFTLEFQHSKPLCVMHWENVACFSSSDLVLWAPGGMLGGDLVRNKSFHKGQCRDVGFLMVPHSWLQVLLEVLAVLGAGLRSFCHGDAFFFCLYKFCFICSLNLRSI